MFRIDSIPSSARWSTRVLLVRNLDRNVTKFATYKALKLINLRVLREHAAAPPDAPAFLFMTLDTVPEGPCA